MAGQEAAKEDRTRHVPTAILDFILSAIGGFEARDQQISALKHLLPCRECPGSGDGGEKEDFRRGPRA